MIIGEAGCRLEEGDLPQSGNDPEAWPFREIARSAARLKPDLVIHVGDYLYGEDACPARGIRVVRARLSGITSPRWKCRCAT